MTSHRGSWAALGVTAALGCAAPLGGAPQGTSGGLPELVIVQFMDESIHPSVAHIAQGGNVAWRNETTNMMGAVVLPADIKESFTCTELHPRFARVAAGYQSEPIASSLEKITLPCPLKPGSYTYEIHLFEPDFGGLDEPIRKLAGTIVVGQDAGAVAGPSGAAF